jgi:hypothetical protein
MKSIWSIITFAVLMAIAFPVVAQSTSDGDDEARDSTEASESVAAEEPSKGTVPDLREEEVPGKFQRKNLVVVPIPMSDPTFGTGLILGGGYFYPQTAAQKAAQPASLTAAAAGYTTNDSWVVGAMQKNYWAEDKWRFVALGGYADFKLELYAPDSEDDRGTAVDWKVRGGFFQTALHRRLAGRWYGGVLLRYLDITQDLDLRDVDQGIDYDGEIQAAGIGLDFKYDSRDLPTNPWVGNLFEASAMTSKMSPSDRGNYQNYKLRFRTYHKLTDRLVLAGDASYCTRSGDFPLWDACWLTLRGFPITRYMAKTAYQAQVEARWTLYKRWGVVAFAGAGDVKDSITAEPEDSFVPSYGAGIRWMVLPSQRLNVRVDYGRSSGGQDAWYLSVMESF